MCKSYEFVKNMVLESFNSMDYKVYITDPGMTTYFSIDIMSHNGPQPSLNPNERSIYDVRIKMEDLRIPGQENLCDQSPNYSFNECVDENIQTELTEVPTLYFYIIDNTSPPPKKRNYYNCNSKMFRKLDAFHHFSQTRILAMEISTTKLYTTISIKIFLMIIYFL